MNFNLNITDFHTYWIPNHDDADEVQTKLYYEKCSQNSEIISIFAKLLWCCPKIHDKWIKPSGNLWSQSERWENQAFGFSPSVLMVLGKIVTNVEKLLPLKLGFFSPSSSVEKLASIVSHFYKSLSSIVIPFTKECDIIFPNHLPNCYLTSSKTMDPTLLWPPGWVPQKLDQQLVREFGQSRCNPIGQRTKGSIFTSRPIVFCRCVALVALCF